MFENIIKFFKNLGKKEKNKESSDTAKERLHLVLMQDRANVSADFLEMMKQEIIEVIKKYIDVDEKAIDVRLTNKSNDDGTVGAPALYANIPIVTIKDEARKANVPQSKSTEIEQKETGKNNEENNISNIEEKIDNNEDDEQSKKIIEEAKKIQDEVEKEEEEKTEDKEGDKKEETENKKEENGNN